MTMDDAISRDQWLATIHANIERSGFHITVVEGIKQPSFAYTIGLSATHGCELVMAGLAYFQDERRAGAIISELAIDPRLAERESVTVEGVGLLEFEAVDLSWQDQFLLGVRDVLGCEPRVSQVCLPIERRTIDVPDMAQPVKDAPLSWQWGKTVDWPFRVSHSSRVVADLDALLGHRVLQVSRWDSDEWEMIASVPEGGESDAAAAREVPLAVLVGHDTSLSDTLDLGIAEFAVRGGVDDDGWMRR